MVKRFEIKFHQSKYKFINNFEEKILTEKNSQKIDKIGIITLP